MYLRSIVCIGGVFNGLADLLLCSLGLIRAFYVH